LRLGCSGRLLTYSVCSDIQETDQASSHSADPSEPSELSQASGPLPSLDLSSLASTLPVAVSRSTPTPPSPQPTSSDPSTSSPVSTFPESQPATAPSSSSSNPLHGKLKGSKLKKALASQAPLPQDGTRGKVVVLHVDLIKDEFWAERPWLLA
jgi:tRNA(His) guanylyltransferase